MPPSAISMLFPSMFPAVVAVGQKTGAKAKPTPPLPHPTETRVPVSGIESRTARQSDSILQQFGVQGPELRGTAQHHGLEREYRTSQQQLEQMLGMHHGALEGKLPPELSSEVLGREWNPTDLQKRYSITEDQLLNQRDLGADDQARAPSDITREAIARAFIDRNVMLTIEDRAKQNDPNRSRYPGALSEPLTLSQITRAREFWTQYAERQRIENPELFARAVLERFDAVARGDGLPVDEYYGDSNMGYWENAISAAMESKKRERMVSVVRTNRRLGDPGEAYGLDLGGYDTEHSIRQELMGRNKLDKDRESPEWRAASNRGILGMLELSEISGLRSPMEAADALARWAQGGSFENIAGEPITRAPNSTDASMMLRSGADAVPELRDIILQAIDDPDGFAKINRAVGNWVNSEEMLSVQQHSTSSAEPFMNALEARVSGRVPVVDVSKAQSLLPREQDERLIFVDKDTPIGKTTEVYYTTRGNISQFSQDLKSGSRRTYINDKWNHFRESLLNNPTVRSLSVIPKAHSTIWPLIQTGERLAADVLSPADPQSIFSPPHGQSQPSHRPGTLASQRPGMTTFTDVFGRAFWTPRSSQVPGDTTAAMSDPKSLDPSESQRLAITTQRALASLDDAQLVDMFRPGKMGPLHIDYQRAIRVLGEAGVETGDLPKVAMFLTDYAKSKPVFWEKTSLGRNSSLLKSDGTPVISQEVANRARRNALMFSAPQHFEQQRTALSPTGESVNELINLGR